MARYQQGDVAAFAELVARHEKRLWNFVRRFVADSATAEDLLQEVFLRVVRNAAEWQPSAKFTTWLYTIARNLCTDNARRGVFRKADSLDQTLALPAMNPVLTASTRLLRPIAMQKKQPWIAKSQRGSTRPWQPCPWSSGRSSLCAR